jgi:uncharacterized RDD family membrane protein YckC
VFQAEETIHYNNVDVCAGCKPRFMQKLAEGANVKTGELNYAGFWIRFLARFIDGLLLNVISILIQMALGFSLSQAVGVAPRPNLTVFFAIVGASAVVNAIYEVVFIGKYGATLGKMACGLKVVTEDGGPVSYSLAIGRYFATIVSAITLYIGFIMAGFDVQKRALHDRICGTRVVRN